MFNRKVEFSVGLMDRDGYAVPWKQAQKIVQRVLVQYGMERCTVYDTRDIYNGDEEPSLVVAVYTTDTDSLVVNVVEVAQRIAIALNQECVLWSVEECKAGLAYSDARLQ